MKHAALLGSYLLLAGVAHAQVGVRAGGHFTALTNRHASVDGPSTYVGSTTSGAFGYQVGVFYQWQLSPRLALVPEVQFRRERVQVRAHDYTYVDFYREWDAQVRSSYVSLPLLARLTVGRFYAEAGPQLSVQLRRQQVGTLTVRGWGTYSIALDSAVSPPPRFDIGPCLGVGVQLPRRVGLSLRAYQGLVALNQEPPSSSFSTYWRLPPVASQRRQYVELALTYQLATRRP